jgi:CRISPR-associated endonuclease Csn1
MTLRLLFGDDSEYQIDHIIPFSFSLDDSFANKVLCHAACNQTKGGLTPFQRFGRGENWDKIIDCVTRFGKDFRDEKLRRFKMDGKDLEEFLARRPAQQFNDSAYASRLAADYLALMYGGRKDIDGNLRVQARSGGLTKYFREAWRLNSLLGDGGTTHGGRDLKPRHNHAHHALDATVIAATDQDMVTRLNRAAGGGRHNGRGRFGDFPEPWAEFRNHVGEALRSLKISHRVSRKVSGGLHKETNYSPKEFGRSIRRHRIDLKDLTEKHLSSDSVIPDKGIREILRLKLEALGGGDPGQAFSDEKNLPYFATSDGRHIPIKKVRIQETVKTRRIGEGLTERHVKPGENHHLEIFGLPGPNGRDRKWDTPGVVTMLEAYQRLKKSEPIVQKYPESDWDGWEFRFPLAQGETLTFDAGPHTGAYMVVRAISQEEKTGSVKIEMTTINDARRKKEMKKESKEGKGWITKSPNELLKWQARKITISPLGDVSEVHD